MARMLLFKEYHRASVHISSCVVLERGGSNIRCSIDEGRLVVMHGGQLVLELIGLELEPHSRIKRTIVLDDPFLHRFQQTARFFAGGPLFSSTSSHAAIVSTR